MKQLIEVVQEYETFLSSSDDEIRAIDRVTENEGCSTAYNLPVPEEGERLYRVVLSATPTPSTKGSPPPRGA